MDAVNRIKPKRLPLYEHIVDIEIVEEIKGRKFAYLYYGDIRDKIQYFKEYNGFYKKMSYDTVSFECLITSVLPGNGALDYQTIQ